MSDKIHNSDFINMVAIESGVSPKDTKQVMRTAEEIMYEEIARGNTLVPFKGMIVTGKLTGELKTIEPTYGKTVHVPEHITPKAKFSRRKRAEFRDMD